MGGKSSKNKKTKTTEANIQSVTAAPLSDPLGDPADDVAAHEQPLAPLPTAPIRPIVFVLGGPGSGKGTQCALIKDTFQFCHLSTGDLLRAEVQNQSEIGLKCAELMQAGALVPDDIILELLHNAILSAKDVKGFLIDGYPRNLLQVQAFETRIGRPAVVLLIDCTDETMTKRIIARGLGSGRADDQESVIPNRLKTFHEQTVPVVEYFGSSVEKVNAEKAPEEVKLEIIAIFNKLLQ